jgi:hypothetical protein
MENNKASLISSQHAAACGFSFYDREFAPLFSPPLFSAVSGGADEPLHRDILEEGESIMKWTIRLRWKGQTIEIEIEIGLTL